MRHRLLVVFLLVIAVGVLGSALVGPKQVDEGRDPLPDQRIEPVAGDTYVWPYTSRSRSTQGRTLALNVVIGLPVAGGPRRGPVHLRRQPQRLQEVGRVRLSARDRDLPR